MGEIRWEWGLHIEGGYSAPQLPLGIPPGPASATSPFFGADAHRIHLSRWPVLFRKKKAGLRDWHSRCAIAPNKGRTWRWWRLPAQVWTLFVISVPLFSRQRSFLVVSERSFIVPVDVWFSEWLNSSNKMMTLKKICDIERVIFFVSIYELLEFMRKWGWNKVIHERMEK